MMSYYCLWFIFHLPVLWTYSTWNLSVTQNLHILIVFNDSLIYYSWTPFSSAFVYYAYDVLPLLHRMHVWSPPLVLVNMLLFLQGPNQMSLYLRCLFLAPPHRRICYFCLLDSTELYLILWNWLLNFVQLIALVLM